MTPDNASLKPSEMVAGGAVPVDKNMEIREARFVVFDYQGKGNPTVAARLLLVDDDGVEFTQHFSAADPKRFQPSQDGKSVVPLGAAEQLSNSSNFYVLLNNMVSAGFPENRPCGARAAARRERSR